MRLKLLLQLFIRMLAQLFAEVLLLFQPLLVPGVLILSAADAVVQSRLSPQASPVIPLFIITSIRESYVPGYCYRS